MEQSQVRDGSWILHLAQQRVAAETPDRRTGRGRSCRRGGAELVERLRAVAKRHKATPGPVAVAGTLRNPAVDGAICGFRRLTQVDSIVVAANLELDDEDLAMIGGRG